jgi:transcription factor IIIB subunit 2
MLIDFAENLQTDVYELGSVFLKFCKLLVIKLDPIDPSLYIHRFAGSLEFGDKVSSNRPRKLGLLALPVPKYKY